MELQLKDLETLSKKRDTLKRIAASGDKTAITQLSILNLYYLHLESGKSARDLVVDNDEFIIDLQLLTNKPVLYVCNVDEKSITGNDYTSLVIDFVKNENAEVLIISAAIEADINELDEDSDKKDFLSEIGLDEPGVNKVIRSAYHLLGLHTFFTAGEKEVRAWTIRKGALAPEAAGVIHTDFEKGFIKAEVISFQDRITLKTENACREAGKISIEGKGYEVVDGDVIHFRFNV
jgi:GTP-binding protein YchF